MRFRAVRTKPGHVVGTGAVAGAERAPHPVEDPAGGRRERRLVQRRVDRLRRPARKRTALRRRPVRPALQPMDREPRPAPARTTRRVPVRHLHPHLRKPPLLSESSAVPVIAGSGLHCSPFIRGFTQPPTERDTHRFNHGERTGQVLARRSARSAAHCVSPPSSRAPAPSPRSADRRLHGRGRPKAGPTDSPWTSRRQEFAPRTTRAHCPTMRPALGANAGSRWRWRTIPRSISPTDTTLKYKSVVL